MPQGSSLADAGRGEIGLVLLVPAARHRYRQRVLLNPLLKGWLIQIRIDTYVQQGCAIKFFQGCSDDAGRACPGMGIHTFYQCVWSMCTKPSITAAEDTSHSNASASNDSSTIFCSTRSGKSELQLFHARRGLVQSNSFPCWTSQEAVGTVGSSADDCEYI